VTLFLGLSRAFVARFVARLRCSACRVSLLSSTVAFVFGFCFGSRLLPLFSTRAFAALARRVPSLLCGVARASASRLVPCFGPLCLASGLCALLRAFVPCFGPLCLASGLCALLRAFVPCFGPLCLDFLSLGCLYFIGQAPWLTFIDRQFPSSCPHDIELG
jgi:hypothetical protein